MYIIVQFLCVTNEVVASLIPHVGVVPITIIHPSMVGGGLESHWMGIQKPLGDDMLVAVKALNIDNT